MPDSAVLNVKPPAPERSRVDSLDGIRGLAIVMVMIAHYFVQPWIASEQSVWSEVRSSLSWLARGVDLFFVLSGFLIGGLLIDHRGHGALKTFYIRRFCRILPLYFLMVIPFILGNCFLSLKHPALVWLFEGHIPLLAYLAYLQNFWMAALHTFGPHWMGVTWSLAIEEQFYVMLPLLIAVVRPKYLAHACVGFILMASIFRTALSYCMPADTLHAGRVLLPSCWDALFLGVLAAIIVRVDSLKAWLSARRGLILAAGIFVMILAFATMYINHRIFSIGRRTILSSLFATWFFLALLLAVIHPTGMWSRFLSNPILRYFGRISYGLYLFHVAVLGLLFAALTDVAPTLQNARDLMVTLFSLVLAVALSHLSWEYFEKHFVRFGHSFKYRKQPTNLETQIASKPALEVVAEKSAP